MTDIEIREIYLSNEHGKKLELLGNLNKTPFLYQPKGLGLEREIETTTVINKKYVNDINNVFTDISGTLILSSYVQYDEVEYFLTFSKKLKLYYKTVTFQESQYFDVVFKKMEQTEKDSKDGLLKCPIAFEKLSYLKKDKIATSTNQVSAVEHNTFPLGVDTPCWLFTSGYDNKLYFNIYSTTAHLIPARIEIKGGYVNPTWINLSNGLKGRYSVSASNGLLIIDSDFPQQMSENGEDMTQKQAQSGEENFLYLSPGKNEIEFTIAPNTGSPTYTEIKIYWSNERG
jgi:hypothetical protein